MCHARSRSSVCQRRFQALKHGGKAQWWKSVRLSLDPRSSRNELAKPPRSCLRAHRKLRVCVCVSALCVCESARVICETDSPPCSSGCSVVSLLNVSHLLATAADFSVSNIPAEAQVPVGTLPSCRPPALLRTSVFEVQLKEEAFCWCCFLCELGETEGDQIIPP